MCGMVPFLNAGGGAVRGISHGLRRTSGARQRGSAPFATQPSPRLFPFRASPSLLPSGPKPRIVIPTDGTTACGVKRIWRAGDLEMESGDGSRSGATPAGWSGEGLYMTSSIPASTLRMQASTAASTKQNVLPIQDGTRRYGGSCSQAANVPRAVEGYLVYLLDMRRRLDSQHVRGPPALSNQLNRQGLTFATPASKDSTRGSTLPSSRRRRSSMSSTSGARGQESWPAWVCPFFRIAPLA